MVGQDGLVLLANPAAQVMLGVAPEVMTGRPFFQVIEHEPLRRLFEVAQPDRLAVLGGDEHQARLGDAPIGEGQLHHPGLAAILRDITLLKNLEQMKNDFVNTVSHDLKSPIMAIAMTTELLMKTVPATGEEVYRERCRRILRSANQMTELVTDLLDLGKIEAGLEGPGEPVDLVALIGEAVKALAAPAEGKRIAIAVEAPAAALVTGVRPRLSQVLENLVGNAVKYTRDGGRVQVVVEPASPLAGAPIRVRVTDTGIGIPARDLPHVFNKFYLVKNDPTLGISGTGLGLAITRSIAPRPHRRGERRGSRQHVLGGAAGGARRRRPPRVSRR